MRRRDFISLLGSAAGALPLALHAQQEVMPVIGYLSSFSPTPNLSDLGGDPFHQGLSETGYVEGQNVAFEYRWAEGHYDRLPALAADLVGRKVDLIKTAGGTSAARPARTIDRGEAATGGLAGRPCVARGWRSQTSFIAMERTGAAPMPGM